MNEEERKELTEEYGRGFDLLQAAIAEIPREAWNFKPAAGEWSVMELLGHITDSEILGATRLYMIIAMPGSTLMSYDGEKWADALNYPERSTDDALQLFRLLRQTNVLLLRRLPEAAFLSSVIHPDRVYLEYGEAYTIEKWLRIYTRHVRDHTQQLEAIHRAWREKQTQAGTPS